MPVNLGATGLPKRSGNMTPGVLESLPYYGNIAYSRISGPLCRLMSPRLRRSISAVMASPCDMEAFPQMIAGYGQGGIGDRLRRQAGGLPTGGGY